MPTPGMARGVGRARPVRLLIGSWCPPLAARPGIAPVMGWHAATGGGAAITGGGGGSEVPRERIAGAGSHHGREPAPAAAAERLALFSRCVSAGADVPMRAENPSQGVPDDVEPPPCQDVGAEASARMAASPKLPHPAATSMLSGTARPAVGCGVTSPVTCRMPASPKPLAVAMECEKPACMR